MKEGRKREVTSSIYIYEYIKEVVSNEVKGEAE